MATETPNTVHGRLLEAVHISGYSFERACGELEWLLDEDRWKGVAGGFDDVNAFLDTLNLSEFRVAIDRRKKLAQRLAAIQASQSATARLFGVDESTIRADLGKRKKASSGNPETGAWHDQKTEENHNADPLVLGNPEIARPTWFQQDVDPTQGAKRASRRQALALRRMAEEQQADGMPLNCEIRQADVRSDYADLTDVHAIVTDPPYAPDALPLYDALARFAQRVLRPDGVCAVMTGHLILPDVLTVMRAHLPYRWTMAYLLLGAQSAQGFSVKVNSFWKPVILFGAARDWLGDVAQSAPNDNDKRFHTWGQSESGMRDLVQRLTKPGDLVCDPFLGGGTTAVVCHVLHRRFIGGDQDPISVEQARRRCSNLTLNDPLDQNAPAGAI